MAVRELEKVRQLIMHATALDLAYAYDDLVIAEHSVFIVQFDAHDPKCLHIFFNHECWEEEREQMQKSLSESALARGFDTVFEGLFKMRQKHSTEEIELVFMEKKRLSKNDFQTAPVIKHLFKPWCYDLLKGCVCNVCCAALALI